MRRLSPISFGLLLWAIGAGLFSWQLMQRVAVLEGEVADYEVARRFYSDRFIARNHKSTMVITPRAVVFKRKGFPSLRMEIVVDTKAKRLTLVAH